MKPGSNNERYDLPRSFRQLLLQLARESRSDLKKIPHHPKRAIHALRTRMKKLSAIVNLVGLSIPARTRHAILASTKRLKNAFASQRDAQVAAEMGIACKPLTKSQATAPLYEETSRLAHLLQSVMLDGLTKKELCKAYVETYRTGRKHMKQCLADPDPTRLHAWRKPVKELYYQSLALHRAPGMTRRIRRARRLGRWLGKHHDWQLVLERQLAAGKRIQPKRERLRRRIFKLASKLYAVRPKKLSQKLK
ncbi:MAG: CHAD domain-containing protein [Verrucomicrobia bacterium]|nr:CHAD domain-containing protein [Verrucomicrobiota bacterium]